MKKVLLLAALAAFIFQPVLGQDLLYYEGFDNGAETFEHNTYDMNSGGASTFNDWVVNNEYSGGSGSFECFYVPFTFDVPTTPQQPAEIEGAPNSNYLHMLSDAAVQSGIYCSNFLAADGLCNAAENSFTKMSYDLNTEGYDTVTLTFWWLCAGGASSYGEVYYSTDSGGSWQLLTSPMAQYSGQNSWVQASIQQDFLANQSTLRFGFRFVNDIALAASDPAFAIDDIRVWGAVAEQDDPVAAGVVSMDSYKLCSGETVTISFELTEGEVNADNIYTLELSDPDGNFDTPTLLGTLESSDSSGEMQIIVPNDLETGSAYRVRINTTSPESIGVANTIDISISPTPDVDFVYNYPGGNTIYLVNTSPAYTDWTWYLGDGNVSLEENPAYSYEEPGTYEVCLVISDDDSCPATYCEDIELSFVGIEELDGSVPIAVHQNLSFGHIYFDYSNEIASVDQLQLFNINGQHLIERNEFSESALDLTHLSSGVYVLVLNIGNKTYSKKLEIIR